MSLALEQKVPGADPRPPNASKPGWVIEPRLLGWSERFVELWRYRRVLWFFAKRALLDRYQGMALGWLWLFIRPLAPIFISTAVFGGMLGVPSDGLPYFLFFLAGTAIWTLFDRTVIYATRSLTQARGLITKIYFPRLIVPIAAVTPAAVYFLIFAGLLVFASIYYRIHDGRWYTSFSPSLLISLGAAILSAVFAIAVGLWTCVWQLRVRDVQYTIRYVLPFWVYLTPIIYPLSSIPAKYHWLVMLNPMAALVEGFKWGLFGVGGPSRDGVLLSVALIAATLVGGIWYFDRSEAGSLDKA